MARPEKSAKTIGQGHCALVILLSVAVIGLVAAEGPKPKKGDLVQAIVRGDEEKVRSLLRQGADVNENVGNEYAPITPLFAALAMDEEKIARLLIVRGAYLHREFRGYTAADLAHHWGQESLEKRLASEMAGTQKEKKGSFNIDSAVWVANGLAALSEKKDDGTALGLAYIVAFYQLPMTNRIDRRKVFEIAVGLRKECEKCQKESLKAGKTGSLSFSELSNVAFEVLDDRRIAMHVTQALVSAQTVQSETQTIDPSFSIMRNIVQHGLDRKRFHTRTLEGAYRLGTKDKDDARWVINEFTSSAMNASLSDKAHAIEQRNSTRFHNAVLTFVRSDDARDHKAIEEAWGKLFKEIHKGSIASIETLKEIKEAKRGAIKHEERRQTFEALDSSLYLLTSVIAFKNPELAHQIHTIGQAGIEIGKSVSKFVEAGPATLASSITLIGGVVSAGMMIASLFDSSPSPLKQISKQIEALHQEVREVHIEMRDYFQHLDRRLKEICDVLVRGFNHLTFDLALARDELQSVAAQISIMESHLLSLESTIREYFEVGIDRSIWRKVTQCMEWNKYHQDPLSYAEFIRTLDTLVLAGTREAKDILAAGRGLRMEELEDPRKLAAQFLAHIDGGMERNIGIMRSISLKFCPECSFSHVQLANPIRWAMMVEAYTQLALKYPGYYKRTTRARVDDMIQIGKEWRDAVRSLTSIRTKKGSEDAPMLYIQLLENYNNKANLLCRRVNDRIETYQHKFVEGYNLFGETEQKPQKPFSLKEIQFDEKLDLGKWAKDHGITRLLQSPGNGPLAHFPATKSWKDWDRRLPSPACLNVSDEKMHCVPRALQIAQHLGLGEIRIRWTEPDIFIREKRALNKDVYDVYGEVSLVIHAFFVEKGNGVSYPLFRHQVQSGESVRWGRMIPSRDSQMVPYDGQSYGGKLRMLDSPYRLRTEIEKHWSRWAKSTFETIDWKNSQGLKEVKRLVSAHFKRHREIVEQDLWTKVGNESDGDLVDAMRQLTAAKAMLDAFVTLGMAKSLGENQRLHDLLAGESIDKGRTRLLDRRMIEAIATEGELPVLLASTAGMVASPSGKEPFLAASLLFPERAAKRELLLEIARDKEWLFGPANELKDCFKNMPRSSEPQPLIEQTMERLELLTKMHREAANSSETLPQAAQKLRESVQAFSRK